MGVEGWSSLCKPPRCYCPISAVNPDKGRQPIIPRVGNVLLSGFQFEIVQLSVAD